MLLLGLFVGIVVVVLVAFGAWLFYEERKSKRELDEAIAELAKWARFTIYLNDELVRKL